MERYSHTEPSSITSQARSIGTVIEGGHPDKLYPFPAELAIYHSLFRGHPSIVSHLVAYVDEFGRSLSHRIRFRSSTTSSMFVTTIIHVYLVHYSVVFATLCAFRSIEDSGLAQRFPELEYSRFRHVGDFR